MSSRLRLTRTYSMRSLIGIAIIAAVLVGFYRYLAVENLKAQETNFNVSLAQSLSANLWPYYAEFVREARIMPPEALARTPQFQAMQREIMDRMRGLRVVKVRIYDPGGLTVFSSDLSQIGEDRSADPGFMAAAAGQPRSRLLSGVRVSGLEGAIDDAELLSSYIPVRRDADAPIEGVFELFSDVTPLVADIERTSYTIVAVVTTLLLLLYLFLLAVVQRADRLLDRHEREHQRRQQARLEYLSRYDALTDLPNRSHFMHLLSAAITQARREGTRLGMIYVSIDRFKLVNDSFGHELGDRALVEFARRLRACAGEEAIVARMGGDHFAVIDRSLGTPRLARACAERIIEQANTPIQANDREIVLTASLGVATLGPGAQDAELLVENAIAAMRKAKRAGRNGLEFFAPDGGAPPHDRLGLETDLRKALVRNELVLHYQPRVDTRTGQVSSLEALVRWNHPQRGLLMPTQFVPLLEEMDLMIPVGAWVLEEACRQLRTLQDGGATGLRMSVNVSLRQFRARNLLESVRNAIQASGIDSARLELELTESALADDLDKARAIVTDLRTLGVTIAVDDFGTGYSALSYLIHFPVDCLKLDRVFVTDLPGNRQHAALTSAIAAMAESLGLCAVAEGVETQEQYAFIGELGYTEVQGFWVAEPCAGPEVPQLLAGLAARAPGLCARPAAPARAGRRAHDRVASTRRPDEPARGSGS